MIVAQRVYDDMGTRSTVVDVAEDVELVDGQALDNVGYRNDKIIGTACGDDSIDDSIDIGCLIAILGALVQQLLNDVAEFRRQ